MKFSERDVRDKICKLVWRNDNILNEVNEIGKVLCKISIRRWNMIRHVWLRKTREWAFTCHNREEDNGSKIEDDQEHGILEKILWNAMQEGGTEEGGIYGILL